MVESTGNKNNTLDKNAKEISPAIADKSLHLCMVGADKHWIEKDVIKFLRKSFAMSEPKQD